MRRSLSTVAMFALVLAGCSSDVTAPPNSDVAASYLAITPASGGTASRGSLIISTTESGVTTDYVVPGADIRLVLAADGSTSGRLFIPGVLDDGDTADFDEDLTGTWSRSGSIITLHHAADTFLRDMPLTASGTQLAGDQTFDNVRVRLILVRE